MEWMNVLPELILAVLVAAYIARSIKAARLERRLNSISKSVRLWTMVQEDRKRTRAGKYYVRSN
jgi:hypothetical protein